MTKVFLDTNIVIDLLSKREPFYNAAAGLFSLADKKKINLSVSSLSLATASYILLRKLSTKEVKQVLRKLRLIVTTIPLDDKVVGLALNDDTFDDFEDGLQYFSAIEGEQDIIITRNLKDFKNSVLPTMSADQYIRKD